MKKFGHKEEENMYNNEYLFRLAKMRQEQILKEVEIGRRIPSQRSQTPLKLNPRVAWVLVGPAFAVVLLSLII